MLYDLSRRLGAPHGNSRRHVFLAFAFLLTSTGLLTSPGSGRTCWADSTKTSSPSELVQEVLRGEVEGKIADREASLAPALEQIPNDARTRWQAGYLRFSDQWRKYDEPITDPVLQRNLDQYRVLRSQAEDTVNGQAKLAEWCRRHNLLEQERCHLSRVLLLDPNHAEARNRLGWRRVGDRWFQEREIAEWRVRSKQQQAAFEKYDRTVKRLLQTIAGNNPEKRRDAQQRLLGLSDPAVIPVVERHLPAAREDAQQTAVELLTNLSVPAAAQSLSRIAVGDPLSPAGQAASKALRDKSESHFVPQLLSLLSTPIASRFAVFQNNRGEIIYRHLFERELEDRREALSVVRNVRGRAGAAAIPFAQQLAGEAQAEENRVADANTAIQELNQRVCSVLRTVTGEDLPAQPDSWWKWWYERNEVYLAGEKPTYQISRSSTLNVPMEAQRYECLVEGTPVLTFSGPVAVEKVQPGDMVLSQNIRTGELGYQPVLATTVRPPNPIVRIETSSDTWRASGGHLFWVVGRGWMRSRQLEPGHRLRTVHGTTVVRSADAEPEPVVTYNLIVADFHSYFIGADKVLSHDNTIPEPVSALVPGWENGKSN